MKFIQSVLACALMMSFSAHSNDDVYQELRTTESCLSRILNLSVNEPGRVSPLAAESSFPLAVGRDNLRKFFAEVYGDQAATRQLVTSGGRHVRHTNAFLQVILSGDGVEINRELLEEAEAASEAREQQRRRLDATLSVYVEQLQGKYRPAYFVKIVDAIRKVIANGRLTAYTSDYLAPLVDLVRQNSKDFLSVLSHSAMIDETQEDLLTYVSFLVRSGVLNSDVRTANNSAVFTAIDDLLRTRTKRWTGSNTAEPMSESSRVVLRAIADKLTDLTTESQTVSTSIEMELLQMEIAEPLDRALSELDPSVASLMPMYADKIRLALRRERQWAAKLTASRKDFASSRLASRVAYAVLDQIARPDGVPMLETNSLLKAAWIDSLDDWANLRMVIINAVADEKTFYDPGLHQSFVFSLTASEALSQFGTAQVDPLLVSQVHRMTYMRSEFEMSNIISLEQEIETVRSQLGILKLRSAAAKIDKVAKGTADFVVANSGFTANSLPDFLFRALRTQVAASPEAKEVQNQGTLQPLPGKLVDYLRTTTLGWKEGATVPYVPLHPKMTDAGSATAGESGDEEAASSATYSTQDATRYLVEILLQIETAAIDAYKRDIAAQRTARAENRPLNPEEMNTLGALRTEILRATLSLLTHTERSFMERAREIKGSDLTTEESAKAVADADATFVFQLSDFPTIRRIIANDNGAILRRVGRFFIDDSISQLYRNNVPRHFATETYERIYTAARVHTRKIVVGLAVIAAGLTWNYWLPPVVSWFNYSQASTEVQSDPILSEPGEAPSDPDDPDR